MFSYEESYSFGSQDSSLAYRKKKDSQYYDESSSLDSAFIMRQIHNQNKSSQSNSVYSSDQTRMMQQSVSDEYG